MAARTRKVRHDDFTRQRIQTSQLVNRLTDHVNGSVELSASQVTAALGLLRKSLPDLANVQHTGDEDQPIKTIMEIVWGGSSVSGS